MGQNKNYCANCGTIVEIKQVIIFMYFQVKQMNLTNVTAVYEKKHFLCRVAPAILFVMLTGLMQSLMSMLAVSQEITDLTFLRSGGYVLMFRHSSAPGGAPPTGTGNDVGGSLESLWWTQCDATVSRQLSAGGRTEALTIGRTMRRLGILVGRLYASEFCRCYETATLMKLDVPVHILPGLSMTLYDDALRTHTINAVGNEPTIRGTNSVVVTHGITWNDTLYNRIGSLGWSDAAVYRARPNGGRPEFVGFIRAATWSRAMSVQTSVQATTQQQPSPAEFDAVSVAPNPSSEILNVSVPDSEEYTMSLINTLGQTVLTEQVRGGQSYVSISHLGDGAYTVRLTHGTKTLTRRFVKAR